MKSFSNEHLRGERKREREREAEKGRERESRLSGLDGDNFHIHDWEETFLLSGANTKFSLWHSQTNICFLLGLCVCVDEKMKEVRQRERLSGIKCHTYCEILLIKKNCLVLSVDVLMGVKWTVKCIRLRWLSTLVNH